VVLSKSVGEQRESASRGAQARDEFLHKYNRRTARGSPGAASVWREARRLRAIVSKILTYAEEGRAEAVERPRGRHP
jgi:hypothetical protein